MKCIKNVIQLLLYHTYIFTLKETLYIAKQFVKYLNFIIAAVKAIFVFNI